MTLYYDESFFDALMPWCLALAVSFCLLPENFERWEGPTNGTLSFYECRSVYSPRLENNLPLKPQEDSIRICNRKKNKTWNANVSRYCFWFKCHVTYYKVFKPRKEKTAAFCGVILGLNPSAPHSNDIHRFTEINIFKYLRYPVHGYLWKININKYICISKHVFYLVQMK